MLSGRQLGQSMLQAAAAFSGGLWAHRVLNDIHLPQLSRAVDEGESFKVSVRVISASIPGLADPGLLTRERPRVSVVLGDASKETELGDFQRDPEEDGDKGDDTKNGPWHFGETLTFTSSLGDVLHHNVQLWLRSHSDVRLGPFQVNLAKTRDIGVCSVSLRSRILPECVNCKAGPSVEGSRTGDTPARQSEWETPVLSLPFTHVGNGGSDIGSNFVLGQAAGHVSMVFSVNTDPKALIQAAEEATRPLVDRVTSPFKHLMREPVRWVVAASEASCCMTDDMVCTSLGLRPLPVFHRSSGHGRSPSRGFSMDTPSSAFQRTGHVASPDMTPDSWVSHTGPNGREMWHHLSLGAPPWEKPTSAEAVPKDVGPRTPVAASQMGETRREPPRREQPMIRGDPMSRDTRKAFDGPCHAVASGAQDMSRPPAQATTASQAASAIWSPLGTPLPASAPSRGPEEDGSRFTATDSRILRHASGLLLPSSMGPQWTNGVARPVQVLEYGRRWPDAPPRVVPGGSFMTLGSVSHGPGISGNANGGASFMTHGPLSHGPGISGNANGGDIGGSFIATGGASFIRVGTEDRFARQYRCEPASAGPASSQQRYPPLPTPNQQLTARPSFPAGELMAAMAPRISHGAPPPYSRR